MVHVGDIVAINYGPRTVKARVVEDRGPLGVGGRQIVVVRLDVDDPTDEPRQFEVPAETLKVIHAAA